MGQAEDNTQTTKHQRMYPTAESDSAHLKSSQGALVESNIRHLKCLEIFFRWFSLPWVPGCRIEVASSSLINI